MKNKQLINEVKRFQKIAGILSEAKEPSYGGQDSISDFEFELDGKEYIAKLTVNYYFDWDTEDGIYNYDQKVEVDELGVAQGDEYMPVDDRNEILNIEQALNTDPRLSKDVEDRVDLDKAEQAFDDYSDDRGYEIDEDSDYDMGTPSGDTDSMNIAEVSVDIDVVEVISDLKKLSSQVELIADKFEDKYGATEYWSHYLKPIYSGLKGVSDMEAMYTRSDQQSENIAYVIENLAEDYKTNIAEDDFSATMHAVDDDPVV